MIELMMDPNAWLAFITLTALEIVLGIDNIAFITILTGRLPQHQQARGRYIGLTLAMAMRILLLFSLTWIMGLTEDLFSVLGRGISIRDLILIGGGAFLMAKSTREVHNSLEGEDPAAKPGVTVSLVSVLVQISLIDMVFSLDSVITAIGLVDHISVMVAAIVVAVLVMMMASGWISQFVEQHPTIKMLALSFLLLIGLTLMIEAFDVHVPKGYIYFAMAFSLGVEMLNIRVRRAEAPIKLRPAQLADLIEGAKN